jgi:ABC-type nitrate/sulfonate/bicarbonate transport system permease component
MTVARRVLSAVLLPIVLIAFWYLASAGSTNPFFPPLSRIFEAFHTTWQVDTLVKHVGSSLGRLLVGYTLACVLGVAFGVLIGANRWLRDLSEPTLEYFRAIPTVMIIPVLMLILGIGDSMKVAVIALGSMLPILLNTVEGVRGVDLVYRDVARAYHFSLRARLFDVILPAASPQIFAGARQSLALAIILLVISEMFGSTNGLGHLVVLYQRSFAISEMWAGILLLGLLGVLLAGIFRLIERRALWWYMSSNGRGN